VFVPDKDPALGEVIHVLMPDAGNHMKHFPRLVYSRDYELPATAASAPASKRAHKNTKIGHNDEQVVELDQFPALNLATAMGMTGAGPRIPLPQEILSVSEIANLAGADDLGRRVAQKWFRGPLPQNGACVARITIPAASLVTYNRVVVDVPN